MNSDQIASESGRRLTPDEIDGSLVIIQEVFRRFRPTVLERAGKSAYISKEKDGSPVTDTDVEIEETLIAELAQRFPGVPVFGEEGGYGDALPVACWLIDPVDGTKSFIENIPTFTSMAVLIQDNEAIVSVIYNPSTDDMYVARKGQGAYKNEVRLDLSAVPLPPVAGTKGRFIDALNTILQPKGVVCEIRSSGAGYGFAMVAEGTDAARFNLLGGGYPHDYATGALLVQEAGGVLLPIADDVYTYETRSFIACHPELESTLRPQIQAIRKLEIELADKK